MDFENYSDKTAVLQITITKPSILNRFRVLNNNKPLDKQIKPFNFMLVGTETNGIIPSLPFTKARSGIQYRTFIDYRKGKHSNELPLPSMAYWKSLQDVLIRYIRHDDHKFDYIEGIAHRKHIIVDRIRYIGKESNNLDESEILGIDEDSYLEYENIKEFYDWILKLKPKDVKDEGISKMALWKVKDRVNRGKVQKLKTKVIKILAKLYKIRDSSKMLYQVTKQ